MKSKNVIISLLIAFVMLFTVFAVNVSDVDAAVNKNTYWIKVNTQCNVVTVYKKSGSTYKPIRAMVCSTGKKGSSTPVGTYRMGTKIGWCKLVGNVWGRYSMVIKGNYLFHSVPYSKKAINKMKYKEYNKLGTSCSHGCVRLPLIDVQWIWDHCPKGTKITVYKSSNPGPLGKPTAIKMNSSWKYDPTDLSNKNTNFKLKKPVLKISDSKPTKIEKGSKYSIMEGVTAKNPNAIQDLTSKVKVYGVYKYDASKKKYVKISKFSTAKTGHYRIGYKVYDYYCGGTTYKNFYLSVVEPEKLTISAKDRTVAIGSKNAVTGVSAKQKSYNRTKTLAVRILAPGAKETQKYSYNRAKNYKFEKAGVYKITYNTTNFFYPYKSASKTIYVTAKKPLAITAQNREAVIGDNNAVLGVATKPDFDDYSNHITVGIRVPGSETEVKYSYDEALEYVFEMEGEYTVTYYVDNDVEPYNEIAKTIKVTVSALIEDTTII